MGNEYLDVILSAETSLADKFDAVKQIEEETLLSEVVLKSRSAEIRSYALSVIKNQDTLIEVVTHDPDATLRKYAIEKLKNIHFEVFEQVAQQDPDPLVREQAVIKMPNHYNEQFASILMEDPDSRVRNRASQKLEIHKLTQITLRNLATKAVDPYIRRAATYSISDEEILEEIAIGGDDISVIQHCIEQINDVDRLKTIFFSTDYISTKIEVLPKIRDRAFIEEIMKTETHHEITGIGARMLHEL